MFCILASGVSRIEGPLRCCQLFALPFGFGFHNLELDLIRSQRNGWDQSIRIVVRWNRYPVAHNAQAIRAGWQRFPLVQFEIDGIGVATQVLLAA